MVCRLRVGEVVLQHLGNGVHPGWAQGSTILLVPAFIWLSPHTILDSNFFLSWKKNHTLIILYTSLSTNCTVLCWFQPLCLGTLSHQDYRSLPGHDADHTAVEGHSSAVCSYLDILDLGRCWGKCVCIYIHIAICIKFHSQWFLICLSTLVNDSVPCIGLVV